MQYRLDIVETDYYLGLIDKYDTFVECIVRNPEIKEYFSELMTKIASCMRLFENLSLLYKGHIADFKVSKSNNYALYYLETFEGLMDEKSHTSKILEYKRVEENTHYIISGKFVEKAPQTHKFQILNHIANYLIKIVCKINKIKEFDKNGFENLKELFDSGKCKISMEYRY
ncbi:hypothetical protein J3E07_001427 [Methanococcus voltae]|uniref:Uncharacterized protein n=1 Tax=Methanococcus voltae TaxID=2188 RepID=A0A8J7UST2_METVO|nr:hypothetical protein [Methanococcus voltae]MBP2201987.1 hypothetical protein [Methanococcus voltae]